MKDIKNAELLKNPEAVAEIDRFKWIASEHLGRDIGFEDAAKRWLVLHSDQWLKHNPQGLKKTKKSAKRFL